MTREETKEALTKAKKKGHVSSSLIKKIIKDRPLSYSSLKAFHDSPMSYIHYLMGEYVPTAQMQRGSLLDVRVLTPELFSKWYWTLDDAKKIAEILKERPDLKNPKTSKDYKDWLVALEKKSSSKILVLKDELEIVDAMKASIYEREKAVELLDGLDTAQKEIVWKHKETGLWVISKIDGDATDNVKQGYTVELKTAVDASPDGFMKQAFNFGYHWQAGTYVNAYRKIGKFPVYWFIVVQNKEPFNVCVFKATDDFLKLGCQWIDEKLLEFKHCLEADQFDASYEFRSVLGYHSLELPAWGKKLLNG